MRVYLASRYSRRDEMARFAQYLRRSGVIVTSRWIDERLALDPTLNDCTPEHNLRVARIDLDDIDEADVVIFHSADPLVGTPRGGRHVEFGYAMGVGKRLVVIGGRENIFHFLPAVQHYATITEFLNAEGIGRE